MPGSRNQGQGSGKKGKRKKEYFLRRMPIHASQVKGGGKANYNCRLKITECKVQNKNLFLLILFSVYV
jgi:hypothetical protein